MANSTFSKYKGLNLDVLVENSILGIMIGAESLGRHGCRQARFS